MSPKVIIIMAFCLLSMTYVNALPLPESGSGSEPASDLGSMETELANDTQANATFTTATATVLTPRFDCTSVADLDLNQASANLYKGMLLTREHAQQLKNNAPSVPETGSCPNLPLPKLAANQVLFPRFTTVPTVYGAQVLADLTGIIEGYVKLTEQVLDNEQNVEIEILRDILKGVIKDYNKVLTQTYCECTEAECFTIPSLSEEDLRSCNITNYISTTTIAEVAFNQIFGIVNWSLMTLRQVPAAVTTQQWINTHMDLTSPAYTRFSAA